MRLLGRPPRVGASTREPSQLGAMGRARAAQDLLHLGDRGAARRKLCSHSHAAWAELLAAGVFPLSRPGLAVQVATVRKNKLAVALHRALEEHPSPRRVAEPSGPCTTDTPTSLVAGPTCEQPDLTPRLRSSRRQVDAQLVADPLTVTFRQCRQIRSEVVLARLAEHEPIDR